MENMDIVFQSVDDVIEYENNPRNNELAIEKVAASIEQFGFKVPIIVDKHNIIVAGHTRLRAAKQLNMQSVPTIRAADLTDAQVKAFRLADNKVSEFSEWDYEKLNEELGKVGKINMDELGFDEMLDDINIDDLWEEQESKPDKDNVLSWEGGSTPTVYEDEEWLTNKLNEFLSLDLNQTFVSWIRDEL